MSKLSFLGRGKAHGRGRNSRPFHPANDSNLGHSSPLVIPTGAPKERRDLQCAPRSLKSFLGSDPEEPSSPHQTAASLLTYPQQQSCGVDFIGQPIAASRWLLRADFPGRIGRAAGRTADPSTTLLRSSGRDDKERGVAEVGVVSGMGRNSRCLLVLQKPNLDSSGSSIGGFLRFLRTFFGNIQHYPR